MHLFGLLGTLMFIVGFVTAMWLGVHKLYSIYVGERARLITSNPGFYIALTAMILGTQLFLAGFLGELITRNSTERNKYIIDEKLNLD